MGRVCVYVYATVRRKSQLNNVETSSSSKTYSHTSSRVELLNATNERVLMHWTIGETGYFENILQTKRQRELLS